MTILPIREQIILLTTFVIIFIVFWIDEQRRNNENHILNKIFKYTPDYNSDQRTGFGLVTVAAVCSIFSVNFYISITILIAGLIFLYKGSTKSP